MLNSYKHIIVTTDAPRHGMRSSSQGTCDKCYRFSQLVQEY
ncbi:hypothetical protein [Thermoanaerobacterium sp. RBIITD]|nr:hypothetical protein [Thermoanaerobacterium sp. RBIITD]